ncbi:MAG: hypothetical protein WBD95_17730, partial [Xanthobacteraceae bacterium]
RFAGTAAITSDDVARYAPIRAAIQSRIEQFVPPDTAIVMPITPCPALIENAPGDVIGSFYQRALTLTSVAGHCGAPQVTLPLGRWHECPIGLAILGQRGSDRALLQLAWKIAPQAAATVPA